MRLCLLVTVATALACSTALAQPAVTDGGARPATVDPSRRDLGLDEALRLARQRNRDVQQARVRVAEAYTGISQAYTALKPTVTAQGKYTHNYKEVTLDLSSSNAPLFGLADVIKSTSGNAAQNDAINQLEQTIAANTPGSIVIQRSEQLDFILSATIPLVVPWAYAAISSQKKTVQAAEAAYAVTEATLLVSTAAGFFAAAGTDELMLARQHAIEVAQKTVDNARARLEAGVVNRVEVTRAELALLRAQQALLEAADMQATAYRSLRTLLQLDDPFRVVAEGPQPMPPLAAPQLAQSALNLRPEFAQLQRTIDAGDAQLSSARWRWAPTLSGFGNLRAFNYAGFAGDNYAWALGLSLDWVIYDGGVRDVQARLLREQRREAELKLAQLRDTVADEVFNARRAVDTKRRALETAARSVELSRETLELVRVQHDAGTATQLDLLQAQDALVTAEVGVAQARFDLSLADLQLRRAAGLFPGR